MPQAPPLRRYAPLLAALALLLVAGLAYAPGLRGPFLLDDLSNLPALGNYGPVDNATTLVSYLTSGIAGPTGRPLALASFLMDARDWPAPAWPFKFTGLLFHLLNGVLLALLLRRLSRLRGLDERRAAWAGLLGAALWLAHPLFVSTALYVVQRMTELAALFVFAGLGAYLHGRARLAAGTRRRGYAWMAAGIGGGTLLGMLAKEDAGLLPLLALVLEFTVLAAPEAGAAPAKTRGWLAFRALFLWLPSAAILAFLAWTARHAAAPVPGRGFSVLTRLISEPRALVHYLYLLAVPHAYTGGLYTEMAPSHGLLHPWTTLPCLALVLALVAFGFAVRRRWPALAAAILFYFAGQLLESTTIPLELYFEHRNYLPAALAFWPLALWLVRGGVSLRLRQATAALAILVLLVLTFMRASLWGDQNALMLSWARRDPNSARAVIGGASALSGTGQDRGALALLRAASARQPDNASIALNRLLAACRLHAVTPGDYAAALRSIGHDARHSSLIYDALGPFADGLAARDCPDLTPRQLLALAQAGLDNPRFRGSLSMRRQFLMLRARFLLNAHASRAAYAAFARAIESAPDPDVVLFAGAYLGAAGAPRLALELLDRYAGGLRYPRFGWSMPAVHRWWVGRSGWYEASFAQERKALEADLAKRPTGAAP